MEDQNLIELVTAAQNGDRDAFGSLVVQFESTVFAIVMKRLRNHAEASEVTQDVFIQAMRKLSQLNAPERFGGWLRQIAVRMSINRAVRRPNECIQSPDTFIVLDDEPENPLDKLLESERATELRGGLEQLGEVDRETLISFYFKGQSLKEMSDEFDRPIGTIKRRLHTARNRLREALLDVQSV
ncbi:ECF RNA polymerase sigma factor SigW [Gimesia panareensis]|uniref:ECF RNA polymerase sigma factor SigW n=1 Tax=Gimesia panareensis TaxID=2527978 RepID=A0A518FRC2_9PLAN|nr:sigma-70 family RNA polymerase sigma factor [Gimesia panareensis]QDV18830.1 ECF RNA polymerase sigma factor SigW [Gimesia panareensis]